MKYLKQFPLSILCTIAITFLSLRNISNLPKVSINHFDKFAHLLAYFVLTAIILFEARKSGNTHKKFLISAFFFAFFYGLLMEFIQGMVPSRNFDLYDMLANGSGALLAFGLFSAFFVPKME